MLVFPTNRRIRFYFDFICFYIFAIIETTLPQDGFEMQLVSVRFPNEFVAYVRRLAKKRRVDEAQIWRDLVATGIQRTDVDNELLRDVFNFTVQNLCIVRRVAGHIDESLIDLAMEDARRALEPLE